MILATEKILNDTDALFNQRKQEILNTPDTLKISGTVYSSKNVPIAGRKLAVNVLSPRLEDIDIEKVAGLGLLLQKLEYNALSPKARKVSDFGVPFKLIDCYDSQTEYDKGQFDAYEKRVDEQIIRLFN